MSTPWEVVFIQLNPQFKIVLCLKMCADMVHMEKEVVYTHTLP